LSTNWICFIPLGKSCVLRSNWSERRIKRLESKGLGKVYCSRIRGVLEANSTEALVPSCPTKIPKRKDYEFFEDFITFD
jgi:hypothetical protein